jgi:hypothetical protein
VASPDKIMIIRHAEKPETPPPAGITADGTANKHSLIVRGWQRAGALVSFFTRPSSPAIGVPSRIYAAKFDPGNPGGIDDPGHSMRPIETITPLAQKLAIADPAFSPNLNFAVGAEEALVEDVQAQPGTVLIAWEHHHIPLIGAKLSRDVPGTRSGSRFDMVWVFDRVGKGSYAFSQVAQLLLAGDEAVQ